MERFAILLLVAVPFACYACSSGSSNEYQYIQNPTFSFNISPPVSWTYFPATSPDNAATWYFVGQSNTSVQASQLASAEITAAMLQALIETNLPVQGVNISNTYVPVQVISPLGTATTGVGPLYGKSEANALTQTAVGGTGVTLTWQPYSQVCTVTVSPLGSTMYTWNIVKNTFMQQLQLNYYARFATDITITGQSTG